MPSGSSRAARRAILLGVGYAAAAFFVLFPLPALFFPDVIHIGIVGRHFRSARTVKFAPELEQHPYGCGGTSGDLEDVAELAALWRVDAIAKGFERLIDLHGAVSMVA